MASSKKKCPYLDIRGAGSAERRGAVASDVQEDHDLMLHIQDWERTREKGTRCRGGDIYTWDRCHLCHPPLWNPSQGYGNQGREGSAKKVTPPDKKDPGTALSQRRDQKLI